MALAKDLFGNEAASSTRSPILPGIIEELDASKTGGRKMLVVAVPEEYAGLVTGIITNRESAQRQLL